MDIKCPNCQEPWDMHHMLHDEPHEWAIENPEDFIRILEEKRFNGPKDPAREAAREAGWEFATSSLLSFIRCPACSEDENEGILHRMVAEERIEKHRVLSELLEDDDDALASELEDLQ